MGNETHIFGLTDRKAHAHMHCLPIEHGPFTSPGPFLRRHRASPPERVDMAILAFHVRKINTFPVRGRPERDCFPKTRNRNRNAHRMRPRTVAVGRGTPKHGNVQQMRLKAVAFVGFVYCRHK